MVSKCAILCVFYEKNDTLLKKVKKRFKPVEQPYNVLQTEIHTVTLFFTDLSTENRVNFIHRIEPI